MAALPALGGTGRHFRSARPPSRALAAQGTQFDISRVQLSSDRIAPCTPSVLCDPAWRTEAAAVVAIYAINQAQGAMGLCTGTLPEPECLQRRKQKALPATPPQSIKRRVQWERRRSVLKNKHLRDNEQ